MNKNALGMFVGDTGERMILIKSMVTALMLAFMCSGCAPAISHQIDSTSVESCRTCHKTGANGAPIVSHADRETCLNCHDQKPESMGDKKPE